MSSAQFLVGDVFERLATIPDGSIDLIVTSPPFLALRSYLPADHPDKGKEIGSEATPAAFLSTLLALTREWRRVLAPHGSLCVELGDTYAGSGGAGGDYGEDGLRAGQPVFDGSAAKHRSKPRSMSAVATEDASPPPRLRTRRQLLGWPLDKSLCLLPTLYPASLAYGRNLLDPDDVLEPWRIRNLVVWHRPNPPVGALGDKVRPSTSYVTVACTSRTRWFDLDAERTEAKDYGPRYSTTERDAPGQSVQRFNKLDDNGERIQGNPAGAPPLDMWNIPTAPYSGSHYATFPPALPRKLINLMCPMQVCTVCGEPRRRIVESGYVDGNGAEVPAESWPSGVSNGKGAHSIKPGVRSTLRNDTLGWTDCGHDTWRRGIVLDPFAGSGTTLMAASELGRDSIGIDLDHRNLDLARDRLGMFLNEPDEVVA